MYQLPLAGTEDETETEREREREKKREREREGEKNKGIPDGVSPGHKKTNERNISENRPREQVFYYSSHVTGVN